MQQFKITTIVFILLSFFFGACNNAQPTSDAGSQGHDHQKSDSATVPKNYTVEFTVPPQPIEMAMPVNISIRVKNTANETEPVLLDVVHEKKIHLIVVNDDMSWFNHIHPEQQQDGTFMVPTSFPYAGKYLLFADYRPTGSPQLVHKMELLVQGKLAAPPVSPANKFISNVDGYIVTLVNGKDFKTNRDQPISIMVEKDGKKLTAAHLQPYLGADAHIVMISAAEKEFMHIHSISNDSFPINGKARFSKPGVYRIWVQFKTNELVHTADLTVHVAAGEMQKENKPADKSHQH